MAVHTTEIVRSPPRPVAIQSTAAEYRADELDVAILETVNNNCTVPGSSYDLQDLVRAIWKSHPDVIPTPTPANVSMRVKRMARVGLIHWHRESGPLYRVVIVEPIRGRESKGASFIHTPLENASDTVTRPCHDSPVASVCPETRHCEDESHACSLSSSPKHQPCGGPVNTQTQQGA